jgi:predicted CopG family antitoxin
MTEIVSLSEKAYQALKRLKRDGESFSDVVSRLAGDDDTKSPLLFAGKWVGDDLDVVFTCVAEEREKSTSRKVSF